MTKPLKLCIDPDRFLIKGEKNPWRINFLVPSRVIKGRLCIRVVQDQLNPLHPADPPEGRWLPWDTVVTLV